MVSNTSYSLQMGETILLPASIEKVQLNAEKAAEVLEIYY